MNAIAAVAVVAEPVAPAVAAVATRQPRGPESGEKRDDFASALAGEMRAEEWDGAVVERAVPADARATDEDDGDDVPPGGNGLPPWLPGMPQAMLPERAAVAAREALEGAGFRAVAWTTPDVTATGSSPPIASDGDGTAVIPAPTLEVAALAPAATVLATVVAEPDPTAPDVADALRDVGMPNGQTRPAQSRSEAPAAAATALANATLFAGTPAEAARDLPPQASEAARAAAGTGGPLATVAELRALPNDGRAPRSSPLARAPEAATTEPVAPPVVPLLRRAVTAALATDAEARPDSASIPTVPDVRSSVAVTASTPAPGTHAATVPTLPPLPVAVGAPEWDRHLSERVAVLVDQGLTNAQLKLSPAHLGPLEIRISVQSDAANVWFGTHSHATREALEAAAPRLRDMLGAQGFANVGVSVDLQQQAWRDPAGGAPAPRHEPEFSFAAGAEAEAPSGASAVAPRAGRSRLDAFA